MENFVKAEVFQKNEDDAGADSGRPRKKQKTSTGEPAPNIIKLAIPPVLPLIVAVTEDKNIHVINIEDEKLVNSTERRMLKRPCAIQLLSDGTILCSDKFGDVYSMPLVYHSGNDEAFVDATTLAKVAAVRSEKPFQPSASQVTVHTARNRKALQAQHKQAVFSPKKEPMPFDHEFLLGHVSMLTDMVVVAPCGGPQNRRRIISADRDEHIRVSRGPPQSHIIEGYCLGHKEFVSKLCPINTTNLVVSGGGDDWLGVWDWTTCTLQHRLDIKGQLEDAAGISLPDKDGKIAVSGLWNVPTATGYATGALLVACERVPALFVSLAHDFLLGGSPVLRTITFDHVPLDVMCVGNTIIISFDVRDSGQARLRAYSAQPKEDGTVSLEQPKNLPPMLDQLNKFSGGVTDTKTLDSLLYGVANLRKRGGWDEDGEEAN